MKGKVAMKDKKTDPERIAETGETTTEFPTIVEDASSTPKKRKGLFRHERKRKAAVDPIVDSTEEDVRTFESDGGALEDDVILSGSDIDDTREISADLPTRPIPDLDAPESEEALSDKGTQLLLEGFEDEKNEEGAEADEEERLRRVRRDKIRDFSERREQHIRGETEEKQEPSNERGEVVYPETPLIEEQPVEETENEPEVPAEILRKLTADTHNSGVTLFFSVVLEVILCLLTVFSALSPSMSMGPAVFLSIHLVLLVALVVLNAQLLFDGLISLFSGKTQIASGVVIASFLTLVHTALQFLNTTGVADGSTPLFTGIAGLGVLMLAIAKRTELERRLHNADWMRKDTEKVVFKRIEDPILAEEIGRPAVAIGEPLVAYYRKTRSLERYAALSEDRYLCTKQMKWYLPCVSGLSFAIALVFFAIEGLGSWMTTITLFCAMMAVSAPAMLVFALQTALTSASKNTEEEGVHLTGYQAIESLGNVHALALDAMDIFPEQSVMLHGIKTFSGTRIDDAILDAASVSVRAGGPLSHVFRRMIVNKIDMLRDVDTLVYEQDMGLSGWVSGRRVLIGNRKLLDNHGIDIPSKDYEQRYAINGRQLVYLSIAGELSAMFVVSYVADPQIQEMLTRVTKQRITLLVRTCDQNINEHLIAEVFDLNGFYVEILNAPAGRSFEGLVADVTDAEPCSVFAESGNSGMVYALSVCSRLNTAVRFFAILQTVLSVIAILLMGYTALFGGMMFPPLYLLEFLLIGWVLFVISALFFGKR